MEFKRLFLAALFFLQVTAIPVSRASTVVTGLMDSLERGDIVLLGEHHQSPDSTRFVTEVVTGHLATGACLTVALEIPSNGQEALDRYLTRQAPIKSVPIHPIIDHADYREMLVGFRRLVQEVACLSVRVADEPCDQVGDRDLWIANQLLALSSEGTPVLELFGNLHALRKVMWERRGEHMFAAKILATRQADLHAVIQRWPENCQGSREAVMVPSSDPSAIRAISRGDRGPGHSPAHHDE